MPIPEIPISTAWNPWIQASIGLTLRLFLPGVAWGWLFPAAPAAERGRFFPHLRAGALAAYIGLMVCVTCVVTLGEAGCYDAVCEWLFLGGVTIAGAVTGAWRDRKGFLLNARLCVPVVVLFAAGVMALMALPRQGEWIVGGWDPGTYVDQGVFVSRHGTFRPGPDPLFSAIRAEDWPALVPRVLNFAEGLPVFPVDPDTRRFEFFFFRGMPAAVALADRCGGLRAATRINMILGLLSFLGVAHAFWSWFGRRSHRWFALVLFATHPIWLYHLHFPTSEMLQQALWFGLFGVAIVRTEARAAGPVLALGCLALVVTHISLVLFVGLFLAGLAWCDLYRTDRARVRRERIWQIGAALTGVGVDLLTSPTTVGRLDFILPRLFALTGLFMAAALAVDGFGRADEGREARASAIGSISVWLALAGCGTIGAGALFAPGHFAWPHYNLKMILPYITPGLALLALAGVPMFRSAPAVMAREAKIAAFLMMGVMAACLVEGAIASLYPWASRRYVALGVPLLAMFSGGALAWLWQGPSRWMKPASVAVFGATLTALSLWSWPAFTTTEYDGLSAELVEVADRIGDRDVVVVDQFKYGVPLRFLHGRHVLNGERFSDFSTIGEVEQAVRGLSALGRAGWTVRFLTVTPCGLASFPFQLRGARRDWVGAPLVLDEIEHSDRIADYALRHLPVRMELYSWDPAAGVVMAFATNDVLDVDVGGPADAVNLFGGFHGREVLPSGRTVRWTMGAGVVAMRGEWDSGARVEVDYVDRHCPGGCATGGVTLVWDDVPLETVISDAIPGEVRRAAAVLPAVEMGEHRLRIVSSVWSPGAALGSQDTRKLGVMADRARVIPRGL